MVVREIKANPSLIDDGTFDFFNDYKDTVLWCRANCPELVERLNKALDKWHETSTWTIRKHCHEEGD